MRKYVNEIRPIKYYLLAQLMHPLDASRFQREVRDYEKELKLSIKFKNREKNFKYHWF